MTKVSAIDGGIGIVRDLRRADAAEDALDLRNLREALLEHVLHVHRLREARAGNAQRMHGDVAFIEARNELRAEPRREQLLTARPATPRRR